MEKCFECGYFNVTFLIQTVYLTCNFREPVIFLLLYCASGWWTMCSSSLEEGHVILENSFQYVWDQTCMYVWDFKNMITFSKDCDSLLIICSNLKGNQQTCLPVPHASHPPVIGSRPHSCTFPLNPIPGLGISALLGVYRKYFNLILLTVLQNKKWNLYCIK